ncbi:MAG: DUF1080 domain-containing protein [Planctomycetota bacterium]
MFNIGIRRFLPGALWLLAGVALAAEADAEGFVSLFNGKDLTGWDGDLKVWFAKDGAIVGKTTPENKTNGTYLICKQPIPDDFELHASFKILSGNSGIQYRTKELPNFQVAGYQADMDYEDHYTGTVYEVGGRNTTLAQVGQKVAADATGKKEVVGSVGEPAKIKAAIKKDEWNEYVIIAQGNHCVQKINGVVTMEITDEKNPKSGIIALQLHPGPPMEVQYKDLRVKELKAPAR